MNKILLQSNGNSISWEIELIIILAIVGLIAILIERNRESNRRKSTPKRNEEDISYHVKKVNELQTTYEVDGNEMRIIDNSKGNGIVRRKLIISREWKKSIRYSNQQFNSNNFKSSASINILEIKSNVTRSIQEKYHVANTEIRSFSEEIELEVMPFSKIKLNIEWKKIWQSGNVELESSEGGIVNIPYKVSKGITFDQAQEKIN